MRYTVYMTSSSTQLTRGQAARSRRQALGLSQRRVSVEADMDASAISRYENDKGTLAAMERQILDALTRLETKARAER